MESLALIGARFGSKGVPGKNIRSLHGHSLLSYSLVSAPGCRLVNRVVLSTDSPDYGAVGKESGAEVPFNRPAELAQDSSTDLEYFRHARFHQ
jgi:CMP-N-acetylneuraminic acid synthetase